MRRPTAPRGGRRVDLHVHTFFSDGVMAPEEVVARARERGLAAVAITDHDSLDGIERARVAARNAVEVVPGIEISTQEGGLDLHLLGYFVDGSDPALLARLARFREERIERARAIAWRLAALGAAVDVDEVLVRARPGVVGRPHLAEALVRAGHVGSVDDAFRRFLGARAQAFVPRPAFRPDEAIAMIHAAGGVSVLAHPGNALSDARVAKLAARGLRGIEVWHPQHGAPLVRHYRALATRLGLIATGGSDFHAPGRTFDLGDLPVPAGVLTRLKQAAGVAG
jgi:predicted metal-dependent phosphoesterase TrpH